MSIDIVAGIKVSREIRYQKQGKKLLQRVRTRTKDENGNIIVLEDIISELNQTKEQILEVLIENRDRIIEERDREAQEYRAQIDFLNEQITELESLN